MSAVDPALTAALEQLATCDHLLVALDFDGTLAPFVDRPEDARALPEARLAVERLLEVSHTTVAFVSGRAVDSLQLASEAPAGVLLVGSHGAEYRFDGVDAHPPLDAEDADRLGALTTGFLGFSDAHPGARIERKPAGFAVHTRGLEPEAAFLAEDEARRIVADVCPDATVRDGKDVLEFSVLDATKGDAIVHLRDYTGATAVLYAGDDVTDEDAFAVLGTGDLALKTGEGPTMAPFRVGSPAEVAEVLDRLARFRAATGR
ncbi:trehalose-phosphatase [Mycetocola sp.]|jgi:trehalose-phosphatase|uniref:trehalose-phosphatase n=1 Tax=Mycetocola sp. TaxID=1871042 RepID=UPI0026153868|nr:trehalose-phosphatase [Mycetocola sp.]MCU1419389.1 Trehalose 6-phosphate phosphatase [Mycetocola sp.]MCU1559739.1 Trehalose 6-phosphate phosphatase [Mycetocola sp.]